MELLDWLGQPLPPGLVADRSAEGEFGCRGYVDLITPRENEAGVAVVEGWARIGPGGGRGAEWVLVTDNKGVVVGLAGTGVARPDVTRALEASWLERQFAAAETAGFRGLARSVPGDLLNFYAYADRSACLFAGEVRAPRP